MDSDPMNQKFGKQAFDQAEKFLKDTFAPQSVQAIAEKGIATSRDLYEKAAAAAQDGAKALTEMADTAWGSTKMLNEKVAHNLTANVETAFAAAQEMAGAKSLPEIARLQSEYLQKLAAQATEQTKEFVDLSTRATQHVFEKVQAAATKSMKPTL
jgi:phasin family protein